MRKGNPRVMYVKLRIAVVADGKMDNRTARKYAKKRGEDWVAHQGSQDIDKDVTLDDIGKPGVRRARIVAAQVIK